MEKSFIAYIENSIKNNWDLDALTDYKGATLQYKDVARKIEKLHIIFEESGIRKGDKIAVCGRNSSHWGVTFLATLTYGAVIVPILHEFKADNVHNIVNHSEAKLLFVGDMVWENLNESAMPLLEGILMMNDFTLLVSRSERLTHAREHLNEMFGKKYPKNFRKEHIEYHKDEPEELAVINYTSGTTSYSKGVMLPYRSLWSNTKFAYEVLELKAGDKIVHEDFIRRGGVTGIRKLAFLGKGVPVEPLQKLAVHPHASETVLGSVDVKIDKPGNYQLPAAVHRLKAGVFLRQRLKHAFGDAPDAYGIAVFRDTQPILVLGINYIASQNKIHHIKLP